MKRNKEIDILKGFAIFLMVFDHVWWGNGVHTYIQSFHMPLFFIISGYLWKNGRSVREVTIKKTKAVMVPYIVFAGVYLIGEYAAIQLGKSEQSIFMTIRALMLYPTDMENMPFAPALWFLPCFWICNLIYACLDNAFCDRRFRGNACAENKCNKFIINFRGFEHGKWIFIIVIAATGMTYSTLSDKMLPFALEPVAAGILFMLIGQIVKLYKEKIFYWLSKSWIVILMLLTEVTLAFVNGSVDMRSARYHNCLLYIINGTIGTLVWWGVVHKISKLKTPFLKWGEYLGINSTAFLLNITVRRSR